MIGTIAWRELKALFLSPLAWAILAVVQLLAAAGFIAILNDFPAMQQQAAQVGQSLGVTEFVVRNVFGWVLWVMLLTTPLVTMRLLADEHRNGTLPLLFSAPVSMTEIVLGKYVGVLAFMVLMVAMITLMPLALAGGTDLDYGHLAAGVLGLFLALASFAAVGLFLSTLTSVAPVAAVSTFGVLLLLWIIDIVAGASGRAGDVLGYLSLLRHYDSLLKGIFDTSDVAYYLLFVIAFVGLSIRRLDAERLQH